MDSPAADFSADLAWKPTHPPAFRPCLLVGARFCANRGGKANSKLTVSRLIGPRPTVEAFLCEFDSGARLPLILFDASDLLTVYVFHKAELVRVGGRCDSVDMTGLGGVVFSVH